MRIQVDSVTSDGAKLVVRFRNPISVRGGFLSKEGTRALRIIKMRIKDDVLWKAFDRVLELTRGGDVKAINNVDALQRLMNRHANERMQVQLMRSEVVVSDRRRSVRGLQEARQLQEEGYTISIRVLLKASMPFIDSDAEKILETGVRYSYVLSADWREMQLKVKLCDDLQFKNPWHFIEEILARVA